MCSYLKKTETKTDRGVWIIMGWAGCALYIPVISLGCCQNVRLKWIPVVNNHRTPTPLLSSRPLVVIFLHEDQNKNTDHALLMCGLQIDYYDSCPQRWFRRLVYHRFLYGSVHHSFLLFFSYSWSTISKSFFLNASKRRYMIGIRSLCSSPSSRENRAAWGS